MNGAVSPYARLRTRVCLCLLGSVFLTLPSVQGKLSWETTSYEFEAALGQKSVTARFPFANRSRQTVTITSVRSSCGCTTPTLDKKVYKPGEEGVIEAKFSFGSRRGRQAKHIYVHQTNGESEVTKLTIKGEIPVEMRVKPHFLRWKTGERPSTKRAEIRISRGVQIDKLEAVCGEDVFEVTLKRDEKHERLYHLEVRPRETDKRAGAVIQLRAEPSQSTQRKYSVYAYIR